MSRWTVDFQRGHYAAGRYIRVLNYHSTPAGGGPGLERELEHLAERFDPVALEDLDRLFDTGRWGKSRPGVLPVFYEGYRNNAEVAAPILDRVGLTGWFMVVTGFVDCPVEHQEAFARSHWIGLVDEDLRGERLAMTWDDVADLSRRHVVTPHTASHEGLDTLTTPADLWREVAEPKARMDAVTGRSAPAFTWLHGSSYGRSPTHDAAVRAAGYRYLFSNTMIQRIA